MTQVIQQEKFKGVNWDGVKVQLDELFDKVWARLPKSRQQLLKQVGISLNNIKAFVQRNWANGRIREYCYKLLISAADSAGDVFFNKLKAFVQQNRNALLQVAGIAFVEIISCLLDLGRIASILLSLLLVLFFYSKTVQ